MVTSNEELVNRIETETNPVTLSTLKTIAANRLKDAIEDIKRLQAVVEELEWKSFREKQPKDGQEFMAMTFDNQILHFKAGSMGDAIRNVSKNEIWFKKAWENELRCWMPVPKGFSSSVPETKTRS